MAEAMAATVLELMPNYDAVLVPATSVGKNFAPRLKVVKVTEPPKRVGGIKVETAADLVANLKTAGVL